MQRGKKSRSLQYRTRLDVNRVRVSLPVARHRDWAQRVQGTQLFFRLLMNGRSIGQPWAREWGDNSMSTVSHNAWHLATSSRPRWQWFQRYPRFTVQ